LVEQERRYDEDISKIDQDRSDLQEQNNQLNYIINKLKMELNEKDSLIGRSLNSNDGELKMLKQQLDNKKQENSQLQGSIR
jgi:predicted RNase H-like nuclease (RuvC/YqgF family)